jgi:hypothetical protein
MNVADYVARGWETLLWFAETVIGTVATSIFGGWSAVFGLAAVAFLLFLITRLFVRRTDD